MHREKQKRESIFKKSKNELKSDNTNITGAIKKKKKNKKDDNKNKNQLPELENNPVLKAADIFDMLNSSDENESDNEVPAQINDDVDSDSDVSFDDEESEVEENEEATEQMELKQQQNSIKERNSVKKMKDLLPIKTKSGVIPRSVETSNQKSMIIEEKESESDEEEIEMEEESDDDEILEETKKKNEPPAKKRKLLTATELFQERKEEFNSQKLKIGKICSAITEKPEDRVASFRALLEMAQEFNPQRERNLMSVRKLGMLSMMEVFKDILPDYKVGVTDLQSQKVKKDTLSRVTYENELLKYYKKYLCQLEANAKALKPGKYARRPSKEEIYVAETAIQCLCELILAHTYFNFSTNIGQVLVIYLNCYNLMARKRIHETFIKLFKTDKRLDLTRHVSLISFSTI